MDGQDTADIIVLVPIAGLEFGWQPGQTVTLPADEATSWADGVRAAWAPGHGPQRETTTEPPTPERTSGDERPGGQPPGRPAEQPARPSRGVIAGPGAAASDDVSIVMTGDYVVPAAVLAGEQPVDQLTLPSDVTPAQAIADLAGGDGAAEDDQAAAAPAKKATAKKATPAKKATAR